MKKLQGGLLLALVLILVVIALYDRLDMGHRLNAGVGPAGIDAVYSLKVPERFVFCGQSVPMRKSQVKERFQNELENTAYSHTNLVLSDKRAQQWFPVIEKVFAAEGIPTDFKYLAVVESTLANVVSGAGAAGFWQLMPETARAMGLEVNDEVDERFDPVKSTHAVARYLKTLKRYLGDWVSVTAAYNVGHSALLNARARQRQTSFFDLHLNRQTTTLVYRAMAAKELMENKQTYKLVRGGRYLAEPTISIQVTSDIPDLVAFAQEKGVRYKTLKSYNEWLVANKLTVGGKGKTYTIVLPVKESQPKPAEVPADSVHVLRAGLAIGR
jgi:membrane-bound lytic murein transglycosylase D